MESLDTKLAELTTRDPRWCVWPPGAGAIVLKTEWETYSTDRHGDGLEALVDAALAYVPLPVIPHRPALFDRWAVTIRKAGNRWEVASNLGTFTATTKREAVDAVERHYSLSQDRIEKWYADYGPIVAAGQEGVTFRYA